MIPMLIAAAAGNSSLPDLGAPNSEARKAWWDIYNSISWAAKEVGWTGRKLGNREVIPSDNVQAGIRFYDSLKSAAAHLSARMQLPFTPPNNIQGWEGVNSLLRSALQTYQATGATGGPATGAAPAASGEAAELAALLDMLRQARAERESAGMMSDIRTQLQAELAAMAADGAQSYQPPGLVGSSPVLPRGFVGGGSSVASGFGGVQYPGDYSGGIGAQVVTAESDDVYRRLAWEYIVGQQAAVTQQQLESIAEYGDITEKSAPTDVSKLEALKRVASAGYVSTMHVLDTTGKNGRVKVLYGCTVDNSDDWDDQDATNALSGFTVKSTHTKYIPLVDGVAIIPVDDDGLVLGVLLNATTQTLSYGEYRTREHMVRARTDVHGVPASAIVGAGVVKGRGTGR